MAKNPTTNAHTKKGAVRTITSVAVSSVGDGALESGGNLAALVTRTGEVQASPTANTVLDRLKTIATSLATIDGRVDGLETLITDTNTKLDALNTAIGEVDDTAWDGAAASASLIAIMKACYAKLAEIDTNTETP